MRTPETVTDEIQHIKERLEEIRRLRELWGSEAAASVESTLEEEHRLQALLQELCDRATHDNEGLAEEMVKTEAANADEIPELPPDGHQDKTTGVHGDE